MSERYRRSVYGNVSELITRFESLCKTLKRSDSKRLERRNSHDVWGSFRGERARQTSLNEENRSNDETKDERVEVIRREARKVQEEYRRSVYDSVSSDGELDEPWSEIDDKGNYRQSFYDALSYEDTSDGYEDEPPYYDLACPPKPEVVATSLDNSCDLHGGICGGQVEIENEEYERASRNEGDVYESLEVENEEYDYCSVSNLELQGESDVYLGSQGDKLSATGQVEIEDDGYDTCSVMESSLQEKDNITGDTQGSTSQGEVENGSDLEAESEDNVYDLLAPKTQNHSSSTSQVVVENGSDFEAENEDNVYDLLTPNTQNRSSSTSQVEVETDSALEMDYPETNVYDTLNFRNPNEDNFGEVDETDFVYIERSKKPVAVVVGAVNESLVEKFENVEEAKPKKDKKRFIVDELISTERKYLEDMLYVLKDYLSYFVTNCQDEIDSNFKYVFGNIDKIYDETQLLYYDMVDCEYDYYRLGDVFLQHTNLFNRYPTYCKNRSRSQMLVTGEYKALINRRQYELSDKLGLNSYLQTPIQRLVRYELLLTSLNKSLLEEDIVLESIKDAIKVIQHITQKGNDLVTVDSFGFNPFPIRQTGGFIFKDTFKLISPQKEEMVVFLYQKMIIFTVENSKCAGGFEFRSAIPMESLRKISNDVNLVFTLQNYDQRAVQPDFVLRAKDIETKRKWMSKIDDILWEQLRQWKSAAMLNVSIDASDSGSVSSKSRGDKKKQRTSLDRKEAMRKPSTPNKNKEFAHPPELANSVFYVNSNVSETEGGSLFYESVDICNNSIPPEPSTPLRAAEVTKPEDCAPPLPKRRTDAANKEEKTRRNSFNEQIDKHLRMPSRKASKTSTADKRKERTAARTVLTIKTRTEAPRTVSKKMATLYSAR